MFGRPLEFVAISLEHDEISDWTAAEPQLARSKIKTNDTNTELGIWVDV